MLQLRDIFNQVKASLTPLFGNLEAESLAFILLEHFLDARRIDLIQQKTIPALPEDFEVAVKRLLQHEPVQYIIGKAPFYGYEYLVEPAVLIPRNETEELVHWMLERYKSGKHRLLDIGTGSGCIPITLALENPEAEVFGIDVSEAALEVAEKNSQKLSASVQWFQLDILIDDIPVSNLDAVVSNPPYVRSSEKAVMSPNVVEYEPHLALFVPDEDAMLFYRVIAQKAKKLLKTEGRIYFEINEALGPEVVELLAREGYTGVMLKEDINGKHRMVSAQLASPEVE
jgi:release factor glutamine methyltransferase